MKMFVLLSSTTNSSYKFVVKNVPVLHQNYSNYDHFDDFRTEDLRRIRYWFTPANQGPKEKDSIGEKPESKIL
jgi:hypothetical protein